MKKCKEEFINRMKERKFILDNDKSLENKQIKLTESIGIKDTFYCKNYLDSYFSCFDSLVE